MFRLYGWSFVLSQNSRVSWRRKKKDGVSCVSLWTIDNLKAIHWMYCYPCTLYTLLNLLYPYVYFVLVYTLASFKSLLCLKTLNSSNHTKAEFFFSFFSFFFFFKFFTTLPPLRRFQNIGLSLGSYGILTDFFSSRYVNSSKKQWKSHWVSVEYYLFRILWMLTLLGT